MIILLTASLPLCCTHTPGSFLFDIIWPRLPTPSHIVGLVLYSWSTRMNTNAFIFTCTTSPALTSAPIMLSTYKFYIRCTVQSQKCIQVVTFICKFGGDLSEKIRRRLGTETTWLGDAKSTKSTSRRRLSGLVLI